MVTYAITDTQLNNLRSAAYNATGTYYNTWSAIINGLNYTCLKQGTQILMADGTTKNIEDIQYGDMLKSYDILTNQYIDVKCYGCIGTGRAANWQVHCFENGAALWIYNSHGIYNATKGWVVGSAQWTLGTEGIAENGERTALAIVQQTLESEVAGHYNIFTENNLYFADGILCGHPPKEKIFVQSQGMLPECTPEEVEHFRALGKIYDEGRNSRITNADYRKEAAPYFAEMSRSKVTEAEHQAVLNKSDYKNNKRAQGLIDDIEWAEFTVECNNHRDAINTCRANHEHARQRVNEVKAKYGLSKKKTLKQCFLDAYALDMEFYNKNHNN